VTSSLITTQKQFPILTKFSGLDKLGAVMIDIALNGADSSLIDNNTIVTRHRQLLMSSGVEEST